MDVNHKYTSSLLTEYQIGGHGKDAVKVKDRRGKVRQRQKLIKY